MRLGPLGRLAWSALRGSEGRPATGLASQCPHPPIFTCRADSAQRTLLNPSDVNLSLSRESQTAISFDYKILKSLQVRKQIQCNATVLTHYFLCNAKKSFVELQPNMLLPYEGYEAFLCIGKKILCMDVLNTLDLFPLQYET